jgi:hypothetical protein
MVRGVAGRYAAAAAFFVLTVLYRLLTFVGFTNDDYMHLAYAQQVLLGEWPVRDFEDQGMPLMYLTSAAAQLVGGNTIGSELVVASIAFGLGAALTVLVIADLTGSLSLAILAAALEVLLYPRIYSYPKMALYAVAAAAIVATARTPSQRRLFGLGLLVSVAFLFRHDHGLFIGAACVALVLLLPDRTSHASVGASARALVAGTLPLLAPWAIYVQLHGGLVPYFRSALEYSRSEAALSGVLPHATFDVALASGWSGLYTTSNAEAWLTYLFVAVPIAALATVRWGDASAQKAERSWETAVILSLAVLACAVDAGFLRDSLKVRLPDAAVPAAVLGSWVLVRAWRLSSMRLSGPAMVSSRLALVGALVITVAAVLHVGDAGEQIDRTRLRAGSTGVRLRLVEVMDELRRAQGQGSPASAAAGAIRPYVPYFERCLTRDDRVLVTAFAPELLVMTRRGFAGGHPPFNARYYNSVVDQTRTLERLKRQSVPLVLAPVDTLPDFEQKLPLLAKFVSAQYDLIAETPRYPVRVFAEKARIGHAVDMASGWPCFRS